MQFFYKISALALFIIHSLALDLTLKTNVAVYWGQNSALEQELRKLYTKALFRHINATGQVELNFANQCNEVEQLNCPVIGQDISACQQQGKTVLLSIGGAISQAMTLTDIEAIAAALNVRQMFGPPTSNQSIPLPFGSAIVNGFDLDFEADAKMYTNVTFATSLRKYMDKRTNENQQEKYYLSAAPQCPDSTANTMLEKVNFDMLFVQFYNNEQCDAKAATGLNFDAWEKRNIPYFVGLPADASVAKSGFIAPGDLQGSLAKAQLGTDMSGGMLWDISQAYRNDNYHAKMKNALLAGAIPTATGTAIAVATATNAQ